jgi:hypothetical protein
VLHQVSDGPRSVEFCSHLTIAHTINLELKYHACAVHNAVESEVEVFELNSSRSLQTGEQLFWYCTQIRPKCADSDERLIVGVWSDVCIAAEDLVLNDEGLPMAEVAGVVERYCSSLGDSCALGLRSVCLSHNITRQLTFAICHEIRSDTIHRSH